MFHLQRNLLLFLFPTSLQLLQIFIFKLLNVLPKQNLHCILLQFQYLFLPLFFSHLCSSFLIFFSNSSTKSIRFPKFSNFSQVSSSTIYPFYLNKYLVFPLISLLFNIFLTLYSFFPSIFTRGGGIFFCPFTCF